jgi:hypothetical protein
MTPCARVRFPLNWLESFEAGESRIPTTGISRLVLDDTPSRDTAGQLAADVRAKSAQTARPARRRRAARDECMQKARTRLS